MYRQKRDDTFVGSVEDTYGIDFHARRDMRLGNLLAERGFESVTQLVNAARGRLTYHPAPRKVFLSFHHEDLAQVNGFRLMTKNKHLQLSVSDDASRFPIDSDHSTYVKKVLRRKIRNPEVVICMIGNGTAWREWVDWEILAGHEERRGICGVRLKQARSRAPDLLHELGVGVASWDVPSITAMIEKAAAIRS
ncbi:MAG TPA: TIR domain-containing protein [Rhizomicrobium sp.]|nr:TIR domain-containing protein [Rhizomicrobium sp.]